MKEFEQIKKLAEIQTNMAMKMCDDSMEAFFESVYNVDKHSIEDVFGYGFSAGICAALTVIAITDHERVKAEMEEGDPHDGE